MPALRLNSKDRPPPLTVAIEEPRLRQLYLQQHNHSLRLYPEKRMAAKLPRTETATPYVPETPGEIRIPTFARDLYKPRYDRRLPSIKDFPAVEDQPPPVYTIDHLPPPMLISKILDSFYTCSGTLFYVCSREQSFELFRSLYWGDTQRTKPALAELCAIVAVGSQYDNDGVSNEHRRAFFDTAKIYIDDVVEMSELRAMRLYTLCAMFSIMEKRIAAWSYVGKHQSASPLSCA